MPLFELLKYFPRTHDRRSSRPLVTESHRQTVKLFGRDYFDGDRQVDYGGSLSASIV